MPSHRAHAPFQTYTKDLWAPIWYEALNAPVGLWIKTHDVATLRSVLYDTRKQLADPSLSPLIIRTPPPPYDPATTIWIVNPAAVAEAGSAV